MSPLTTREGCFHPIQGEAVSNSSLGWGHFYLFWAPGFTCCGRGKWNVCLYFTQLCDCGQTPFLCLGCFLSLQVGDREDLGRCNYHSSPREKLRTGLHASFPPPSATAPKLILHEQSMNLMNWLSSETSGPSTQELIVLLAILTNCPNFHDHFPSCMVTCCKVSPWQVGLRSWTAIDQCLWISSSKPTFSND